MIQAKAETQGDRARRQSKRLKTAATLRVIFFRTEDTDAELLAAGLAAEVRSGPLPEGYLAAVERLESASLQELERLALQDFGGC